jgi:hypothetical protein
MFSHHDYQTTISDAFLRMDWMMAGHILDAYELLRLCGVFCERNPPSAFSMKNDLCGEVRAASANRVHF